MSMNSNRFRHALLGASAMISAAAIAGAAYAADARQYDFDMPAQPLTLALKTFGATADQQLIFSEGLVSGRTAPPLKGAYTPDQALAMLLNGSGLTAEKTPGGVVTIRSAADPQGAGASGGADGTVQALIVTAQKREENIQDVPIAMSAFTQEALERSQIAGGPDLMTQVPNMTFTKTNFSGYSIQIRGIGTQAISATTDPAVAVAFNNTPFIRNHFFEQEFYDLERVEVLRGPQGTLYGRNATAGVVNMISAKPKNHFEAKLSADVSNYSSTRIEGMINLPLVEDKAALRIAGAWTKRDGFVKNTLTGEQTDGRDLWSGRVTLGLTPTDKFTANLIYEHFGENDSRLRSGKQLCNKDLGPKEINGVPVNPLDGSVAFYFGQGCNPASLYSPDSFQTPNGHSIPYYGVAGNIGAPVYIDLDPYASQTQSRNLREIETRFKPDYEAANDTVELQLSYDLTDNLTLTSETGFANDWIFSAEDYNRFNTRPGVFVPGAAQASLPPAIPGTRFDIVDQNGVFCDPQLGCTDRLMAGDLATARSKQFSQEFRLSSNFDGPLNFSLGGNFLRYDTEDKYYVFINSLTAFKAMWTGKWDPTYLWIPGTTDEENCFTGYEGHPGWGLRGFSWSNPNLPQQLYNCAYIDPNNIHNLNDEGRNYFLSKNPYHLLSYAAFGELYWQVSPYVKVTAGLRWTVDRKTAPQVPGWLLAARSYGLPVRKVIDQEWREPTGRLAIDYKPTLSFTDETLLYTSYVRGYKAGGANPPPSVITFPAVVGFNNDDDIFKASLTHPETFKPEFVNAYEIGTKNTLQDGKLTFNMNVFYYDYTGYQISVIVDRAAVNLNFDAKIWGSEVEADWRPLENLRLSLKGGYENTRVAKGSKAIDLMDRTAGNPDYILKRPFPSFPSNCIVPVAQAVTATCEQYATPGNTLNAPNNGEGIEKDLSGNALPNAPRFTATLTGDYTVPMPSDWLMTLHTDLYYQSEAWARIFNTPGYDKLKAYNNINVAAIFTNENAGWTVMAYVKNLLNKDNITGAFLNSDDTDLTTNVFLNEPRLYGLRVTKNWSGSSWWSAHAHQGGAWYPYRLEVNGDYGRSSDGHDVLAPATVALFPADHPYPLGIQRALDWGPAGGVKFTYQPDPKGWSLAAGVRYGRTTGSAEAHPKWEVAGGYNIHVFHNPYFRVDPTYEGWYNYITTTASNEEAHAIADFSVGKDMGLGKLSSGGSSRLDFGLRYAHFKSTSRASVFGHPDLEFPADDVWKYGGHVHHMRADINASHEFEGAGPAIDWTAALPIADLPDAQLGLDAGLGAAMLWGRQDTSAKGQVTEAYHIGIWSFTWAGGPGEQFVTPPTSKPFDYSRSKSVMVPGVNANLGLSYTAGGLKVSGGYRIERYFNAIDGGIATRKTYDRQYDGPYFKVSIGFGG
jgi:iron complex outermembrane recepter protein